MIRGRFKLPDGRLLAWREVGSGPAVVLLHGWTMTGGVFSELANLLATDFRVLLPDMPGHGDSSPSDNVSIRQMATDLAAWLQKVAPSPCLLGGWSLGGMVALSLVAEVGLMPEGLVLISTTPRFTQNEDWSFGLPTTEVRLLERNLKRSFQSTLGQFFKRMFVDEPVSAERLREIRQFAVYGENLPDATNAARLLRQFANQDQRALLAHVHCPVLVVHGERDEITPVAAGRYLAEMCKRTRLQVLPAVGHAPFLSQPEVVAAELGSFVEWCR